MKNKKRMILRISFIFFVALLHYNLLNALESNNFNSELKKNRIDQVLLISSQAIDEFPLWSPDSNFIGVNIEGKWCKVNLNEIKLEKHEWKGGKTIGIPSTQPILEEISKKDLKKFKRVSRSNARVLKTKGGTKIELRQDGLSTSLTITNKGEEVTTLWSSESENCHSLVLSPNQKFVAFICELNGLIVMKLNGNSGDTIPNSR